MVKVLHASHPRWLPDEASEGLDGRHMASREHRLKAWQRTSAAPLPGQAVVVLDQQRLAVTDVFLTEDGQAQERRLLDKVLHSVRGGKLRGFSLSRFQPDNFSSGFYLSHTLLKLRDCSCIRVSGRV